MKVIWKIWPEFSNVNINQLVRSISNQNVVQIDRQIYIKYGINDINIFKNFLLKFSGYYIGYYALLIFEGLGVIVSIISKLTVHELNFYGIPWKNYIL